MKNYLNRPLLMDAAHVQPYLRNPDVMGHIFSERDAGKDDRQSNVVKITVTGALNHRGWWNSYERIEATYLAALEDPAVKGIVFEFASPGGAVDGCFDLTDLIYENRGKKPTIAIVNEFAASAAYSLASACEKIYLTRTARVGSVGVLTMHVDESKWLERIGDSITLIFEGAHKVDGNPFEPLPKNVKADIQAELHKTYELFVSTVARNRQLTTEAVIETQARVFTGDQAVELGFADAVLPAREALQIFIDETTGAIHMNMETKENKQQASVDDPTKAVLTQNDVTAASTKAIESDRTRIAAIMDSDEAKGREKMARHLALSTSMTAEDAVQMLASAPEGSTETQTAGTDPLSLAMDMTNQPNITAEGEESDDEGDVSARILKNFHGATGRKVKS